MRERGEVDGRGGRVKWKRRKEKKRRAKEAAEGRGKVGRESVWCAEGDGACRSV